MRRLVWIVATVLAVALIAVAAAIGWVRSRDPLASLPRQATVAPAVVEERREAWEGRSLLHVALEDVNVGRIRFVVSLPDPLPDGPLPLVVVLGSLRGGSESIRDISRVVGDPGQNAFVGYDWPLPRRLPRGVKLVARVPQLRADVLSVPGQVDAIVGWAAEQPWADGERVSLLGFSLGAFVVPAAQRLAEQRGMPVRWTILAYVGAPIGAVVAGHPRAGPAWLRPFAGAALDLLLHPVEPSHHLPHLSGTFLVLGTRTDRLIASAAAERMAELTPEPRTVLEIEGDHMGVGPDRWALLARVVDESRSWLVEEGAIEPPPGVVRPPAPREASRAERDRSSPSQ
jgi:dienelactone hydrolase